MARKPIQVSVGAWRPLPEQENNNVSAKKPTVTLKAEMWNPLQNESNNNNISAKKPPVTAKPESWNPLQKEPNNIGMKKPPVMAKPESWNPLPQNEAKPSVSQKKEETIQFKPSVWNQLPPQDLNKDINRKDNFQAQIHPNQWNQISGLQPPQIIRQFEGVNELSDFSIKDTYATRSSNFSTNKYPSLAVRGGNSIYGYTLSNHPKIAGLMVRGESEVHIVEDGGTWWYYTGSTWTSVKTGNPANAKWSFCNFKGGFTTNNLIAANGTNVYKWDGTTVSQLANAPQTCQWVATHDNRLYLAGDQTVNFSALAKGEDWNTVADGTGYITVETSDGSSITGMIAGSARLTVFKKNSIHELFGNNPSNYQMKTVTESVGCPTGNSAQVVRGVIYFLGNDAAVYRYSGGSLPSSDFSIAVQKTLKSINKAAIQNSVSWTDGKRYYLSIPTNAQTLPNVTLVYDTDFNTWNVWTNTYPFTTPGILVSGIPHIANNSGSVYKLDDSASDTLEKLSGYGASTQTISFEWVSKPFGFSSLAAKSRWFKMWLVADVPTGSTLNVYVSPDETGETWTQVQTITGATSSNAIAQEIVIPTTTVNHSNWVRVRLNGTGPVTIHELSRQERAFPLGQ